MCRLVFEETGLLPHSNPGVLSREEMLRLKAVNASLGMMLETASARLLAPGEAHHRCPDKVPQVRLAALKTAGTLRIPFTTGILVGFQLGLVTISRDKLRRSGFSSKHLEYISYGLPVLTPEWREDPLLDAVSIKYNESNFLDKIWEYSDRAKWESMSERCYQQSLKWTWEKQLKPMLEVLQKELN
jgi:hypothetical protein